jgi:YggT family protein
MLGWGGNPADAPLWLAGAALLAGLALILLVRWLMGTILALGAMRGAGGGAWLRLAVSGATSLLMVAIMVRVIGAWLGAGRYRRWMRPFYVLTDWIVEPIRRRLPPMGAVDLSPVAAYLLLLLLRELLLGALR